MHCKLHLKSKKFLATLIQNKYYFLPLKYFPQFKNRLNFYSEPFLSKLHLNRHRGQNLNKVIFAKSTSKETHAA